MAPPFNIKDLPSMIREAFGDRWGRRIITAVASIVLLVFGVWAATYLKTTTPKLFVRDAPKSEMPEQKPAQPIVSPPPAPVVQPPQVVQHIEAPTGAAIGTVNGNVTVMTAAPRRGHSQDRGGHGGKGGNAKSSNGGIAIGGPGGAGGGPGGTNGGTGGDAEALLPNSIAVGGEGGEGGHADGSGGRGGRSGGQVLLDILRAAKEQQQSVPENSSPPASAPR